MSDFEPYSGTHNVIKAESDYNNILNHAFEKPASFIVRVNGSYYEAIYGGSPNQAGKIAYGGNGNAGGATGTSAYSVIQACVTALTSGGSIFFKAGTYTLTSTVSLASNITLDGEGAASIITGSASPLIQVVGTAGTYKENVTIKNLKFYNGSGNGIVITYARKLTICHCIITKIVGQAIKIFNGACAELLIEGNVIGYVGETIGYYGIYADDAHDLRIIANDIEYCGYGAMYIYRCPEFSITGNTALEYNGGITGNLVIQGNGVSGVLVGTVSGNCFQGSYNYAIKITGAVRVTVSGNQILGGATGSYGLYTESSYTVIVGNQFYLIKRDAVTIKSASYCVVSSNSFLENGQDADNTYSDILLTDNGATYSTRNIIANNTIIAPTATQTKYGIRENAASDDYNIIIGNIVKGQQTDRIAEQGVNDIIQHNLEEA